MVHVGISHTGYQVGSSWTKRRKTHAGTSRQAAIDVGHKSGALFVTRGYEADAGIEQGIHDFEILFSRNTKYVFNTFIFKALNEKLRSIHINGLSLDDAGIRATLFSRKVASRNSAASYQ